MKGWRCVNFGSTAIIRQADPPDLTAMKPLHIITKDNGIRAMNRLEVGIPRASASELLGVLAAEPNCDKWSCVQADSELFLFQQINPFLLGHHHGCRST